MRSFTLCKSSFFILPNFPKRLSINCFGGAATPGAVPGAFALEKLFPPGFL